MNTNTNTNTNRISSTNNRASNSRKSGLEIYLICEGTSCSDVRRSIMKYRGISIGASANNPLCDFGVIESNYFERNTENTKHMEDDGSCVYMASSKMSSIDTALIVFGNSNQRELHIVPYTCDDSYVQSKHEYGLLVDTFGVNDNADRYIQQNKFSDLATYMPSSTVSLNWSIRPSNYAHFNTIQVASFIKMVQAIAKKNPRVKKVFLVCPTRFIMAMMNAVIGNRYSAPKDKIEHTSFWKFTCGVRQGLFSKTPILKERHKMYPLGRNMGDLRSQNSQYYYVYHDTKVPLFYENLAIPARYLSSQYLSLCTPVVQRHLMQKRVNVNRVNNERGRKSTMNHERKNRFGSLLKKFTSSNF